jgi:putative DNA primase/helicase
MIARNTEHDRTKDARQAAIKALAAGLSVWPPKEDGSKAPLGAWKTGQAQRPTLEQLRNWYGTKGPSKRTGIGAIMGKVSGNAECLEFDNGGAAYEGFLQRAEAEGLGNLIERIRSGYEERSASGGIHLIYRCEVISGNVKLAQAYLGLDPDTAKPIIKVLIETRGEGGFVILAPSNGTVHPTGGSYDLLHGGFDSIATITPGEREALFKLAGSFDEAPEPELAVPEEPKRAVIAKPKRAITKGEWDNERRAVAWLAKCEPAISGQGGHGALLWAASVGPKFGLTDDANLRLLRDHYNDRCQPPWSEVELRHKVDEARKLNPTPGTLLDVDRGRPSSNGSGTTRSAIGPGSENPRRSRPLTDLGNAERYIKQHGSKLRYCDPWKKWLVWDGRRWAIDETVRARAMAAKTVRSIYGEARNATDEAKAKALGRWAVESEKKERINALVYLAQAIDGVTILPDQMDADPWLFNVKNGTLDLRTGELMPHDPCNLITKLCPVEYDRFAECPLWEGTLNLFFAGKADLIDYWQRICGYAMAGVIRDHVFPIAYGKGSNGLRHEVATEYVHCEEERRTPH